MGKITEELVGLVAKQIQDHGLVVWYDPEQTYSDVLDQINLPGTTVLRYADSFFELRHRMEPFLEFIDADGRFNTNVETPPRVLVYVSLDRAKTQHAPVEAEHVERRPFGRSTQVTINCDGHCSNWRRVSYWRQIASL